MFIACIVAGFCIAWAAYLMREYVDLSYFLFGMSAMSFLLAVASVVSSVFTG